MESAEAVVACVAIYGCPRRLLLRLPVLARQLDALKAHPNVLVLTTSNITEAIDLAFVDRADIKAYVGPPGLKV